MKDWRGVSVVAGDQVIYSVRRGSSMDHVEAIVETSGDRYAKVQIVTRTDAFGNYRKQAIVSGKHLTVVTGLPLPDDTA